MKGDKIKTQILSVRIIPNADEALRSVLMLPKDHRSLGILTTDCDDVSYAALDEATKKAQVYAGSANASTALAGEFIGILSATEPSQVRSGLEAAIDYIENDAFFYSANDDDSVVYFAQCISRTGSYLSGQADVSEGTAMAYLIAPPLEAVVGVDAALKAADVRLSLYYGPPTETNFAGGLLTGTQAACQAACEAFAEMICQIAAAPLEY